jgi:serine/threonine protein kinase
MEPLASGDPARIGPFRLVARLGRGGMGRVYLGRSETTGRTVAVKTVHGELLADAEFRTRFSHEVAAALKVRDEFIAEVVDADPDGATPWLATAYVPGISLEDAVRRFGPLPADSVRILGVCIAKAVAAIHAVGLVHRDLKPANVLLTADGPKVIDFGIARGVSDAALTKTGMVSGSPPYMAPEQLGYGEFSTASDVFSLGAVLHYAATAAGPYGRGGAQEQYARAMGIGPVVDPSLPEPLTHLVRRCFADDPTRRPTTAHVVYLLETHPGERPLPGWLPTAVLADILAQATDALNKDSAAGHSPQQRAEARIPNASSSPAYAPPRPQQHPQPQPHPQPHPNPNSRPPSAPAPRPNGRYPDSNSGPHGNGSRSGAPFNGAPPHSAPGPIPRHEPQSQPYQQQQFAPQHLAPRTGPPQPYPPHAYAPQPPPPLGYVYPHQAPPPSNGIAVAALVLSLVGFVAPCLLVAALPLGGVGLAKSRKNGVGHGQSLAAMIVASMLLLGWTVFLSVFLSANP